LWVADYTAFSNNVLKRPYYMPKPWTQQTIWQFSADGNGRGHEFGTAGNDIDLNWFEGSYDDLIKFVDKPGIVTPPIVPPVVSQINIKAELATIRAELDKIQSKVG